MAYAFDGGTVQRILFSAVPRSANLTSFTISAIVQKASAGGASAGRVLSKGDKKIFSADAATLGGIILAATNVRRAGAANSLPDAATTWAPVCMTWTGDVTQQSSIALYVSGAEIAPYGFGANGAAPVTSDSSDGICIGNRASDGARGWNGALAEVAVWASVLTAAEINSLSRGFAPRRIRPQSLVHYSPLVRNAIDVSSGAAAVTVAATAANHPRVY